jgi:RNA polymerase sigma-70 factor (ECF subfamily)
VSAFFRSASTSSFDKLYAQHAASVYRYLRAVLGNHADAEDVTQQVFLNAYRALERGTKPRRAENWLFTIAHNESRRHLRDTRGRMLEVELVEDDLSSEASERSGPSVSDILRALQQLTPNQRSALVMREFEGRSYAEISRIMDMPQSALETLVFRARRALAEALEDGLTCEEAELALSRRLDKRLSRRESKRLKAHMRECDVCTVFEARQKRQRSLLRGLPSIIPIPASLLSFRGEQAAAAVGGLSTGAAVTGGSVGVAAKAAAIVAAVTVAGGVGATTVVRADTPAQPESTPAAKRVLAAPTRARTADVVPSTRVATPVSRGGTHAVSKVAAKPGRGLGRKQKTTKQTTAPVTASGGTPASEPRKNEPRSNGPPPGRGIEKAKIEKAQADKPAKSTNPTAASARERRGPVAKPTSRPVNAAGANQTTPAPAVPPGQTKKLLDPEPEAPKPDKPEQARP